LRTEFAEQGHCCRYGGSRNQKVNIYRSVANCDYARNILDFWCTQFGIEAVHFVLHGTEAAFGPAILMGPDDELRHIQNPTRPIERETWRDPAVDTLERRTFLAWMTRCRRPMHDRKVPGGGRRQFRHVAVRAPICISLESPDHVTYKRPNCFLYQFPDLNEYQSPVQGKLLEQLLSSCMRYSRQRVFIWFC
jgi:hypothetical protein